MAAGSSNVQYVHDIPGPKCRPRGAKTHATRSHVLILLHSISGPDLCYQRIQGRAYCGVLKKKNCWSLLQRTSLRYHQQRVRGPQATGDSQSLWDVSELRTRRPLQMAIVWRSHSDGSESVDICRCTNASPFGIQWSLWRDRMKSPMSLIMSYLIFWGLPSENSGIEERNAWYIVKSRSRSFTGLCQPGWRPLYQERISMKI